MSKLFFPVVTIQTLLIFTLISYSHETQTSSLAIRRGHLEPEKLKDFRHQVQAVYPVLKSKGLTKNIQSLLISLRRKKRRSLRKSRFIIKDSRGKPILLIKQLTDTRTSESPLVHQKSATDTLSPLTTPVQLSMKRVSAKSIIQIRKKEKQKIDPNFLLLLLFSAMEDFVSSYIIPTPSSSHDNNSSLMLPISKMISSAANKTQAKRFNSSSRESNSKTSSPQSTEIPEDYIEENSWDWEKPRNQKLKNDSRGKSCGCKPQPDEDYQDEYDNDAVSETANGATEEKQEDDIETTPTDNVIIHKALFQSIVNSIGKEDLPCNIEGYWSSFAAGKLIKIKRQYKKLHIKLLPKTPPAQKGFLLSSEWRLHGKMPFYPRNNIITINGFNEKDRHIASFIGECRICNGCETVTGNWLLGRASRDCRDQRASEELISDIWKREMLNTLRNQRRQNKEATDV